MRRFLHQNIFCLLVVWLSIGIATARYAHTGFLSAAIVGAVGCTVLILTCMRRSLRTALSTSRHSTYTLSSYALIFISIGMADTTLRQPSVSADQLSNLAWMHGVVKSVRHYGDHTRMEVALTRIRNVNIYLTADSVHAFPGDSILWRNELKPIKADSNRQGDAWPEILALQGILYCQHLSAADYRIAGHDNSLVYSMVQARSRQCELLAHSRLSEDAAALTAAVITGDRQALSASTVDDFRLTGLSHILALSGLHIGILASLLLLVLRPLNLIRNCHSMKIRWIVAAIMLWGYAVFTGLSASVVRACVMATVLFIAIASERSYRPGNALGLAAFVILLFDPLQLFQAGFQLSFLVTALILAATRLPQRDAYRREHRAVTISRSLLIAVVAMVGSWLLTAFYFHSLPFGSLPWNILVALILPIYFIAAVVYTLLLNIGCDPGWAASIVTKLAEGVLWCGNHPEASISVWLNGLAALWGGAALASVMIWIHLHTRKWLIISIVSLLLSVGCVVWLPSGKPKDGFIVQNYAHNAGAAIRVYADGRDSLLLLPADTSMLLTIHNRRILLLDTGRYPADTVRCNLMLAGPRFRGTTLPPNIHADTILLLPTIYPTKAERLRKSLGETTPVLTMRSPYPSFNHSD